MSNPEEKDKAEEVYQFLKRMYDECTADNVSPTIIGFPEDTTDAQIEAYLLYILDRNPSK